MKVSVSKPNDYGHFDKSGINQSTCNFGFVQPTRMVELQPGENATIEFSHNTIMTPLRVPTQGEITMRHYISAVKVQDILEYFPNFYAGRPYSWTNGIANTPTTLPCIDFLGLFLTLLVYDERCNIWYCEKFLRPNNDLANLRRIPDSVTAPISCRVAQLPFWPSSAPVARLVANVGRSILSYDEEEFELLYPRGTFDPKHGELFDTNEGVSVDYDDEGAPIRWHFDGCEYFIPCIPHSDGTQSGYVIKLGDFGLRLRSIFNGLMFNIDSVFQSLVSSHNDLSLNQDSSILPLLAYAKSIYDTFGIKRFVDYPMTYLGKAVQGYSHSYDVYLRNRSQHFYNYYNVGDGLSGDRYPITATHFADEYANHVAKLGCVLVELMYNSYFQLDVDYFSSINNTIGRAVGTSLDMEYIESGVIDSYNRRNVSIDSESVFTDGDSSSPMWIKLAQHALRWLNTDNIIGASLHKWLQAHNVSMDNAQTLHLPVLDRHVSDLSIAKLPTTADTEQGNTGDFGAIGGGDSKSGKTHVNSDTFTYVFAFYCIVPKVGYYQGAHYAYDQHNMGDFYHDEYDSLGYVPVNAKRFFNGVNRAVGFHPRYFDAKMADGSLNVINGDLTRGSTWRTYEAYYLERQFNNVSSLVDLAQGDLLIADSFRKIGLNQSYGNYLRIFQNTDPLYDHFINTFVYKINTKANMKPVSRSFDTINEGDAYVDVTKA